jgi:hypothetical protein
LADLERDLSALATEIDWPATPTFFPSPARRGRVGRGSRWRLPRRALAAAAVVLAALVALASVPPARDAVATILGLRGVVIQKVPNPPTPSPPRSGSLGERLDLGTRLTLEQAQAAAGFHVLIPAQLGQPDEVYYNPGRKMVSLVYAARPGLSAAPETGVGLLVSEFPGQLEPNSMAKVLGSGSTLQPVDLGGGTAYFIAGQHVFYFFSGPGGTDQSRLAANTLIWQRSNVLIRLEGEFSEEEAAALARSLG